MSIAERRLLRRLRDADDNGILLSSVGKSCQTLLLDLEQCSAVSKRLIKAATRVQITNRFAFESFMKSRFPLGIEEPIEKIHNRAGAVAAFGDAKAIKRGSEEGIMIRTVHRDAVLTSSDGEKTLRVGELSGAAGGAAFQLTAETRWTFPGSVVVVENAEPFWRYEEVMPEIELAVYASGNMSSRLVDWLTDDQLVTGSLFHWGDYDPRGVSEFLRLSDRRRNVISFVPENIDDLMIHGQRSLLLKQAKILESIRKQSSSRHVDAMVALFDKHGRALEQEALLQADSIRIVD